MSQIIEEIVSKLSRHEKGFWVSPNMTTPISYPDAGNDHFAEIEQGSFWFNHRNNVIVTGIENYPPNGTIFDIGGGNGFVAKHVSESGFSCVLIEPGIDGACKAVERGVEVVIQGTVESVGIKDETIAAVGLFDVVEHIEDDLKFLSGLRKKMVVGGRLYATVPAYEMLWSHEDVSAGHFRRYSNASFAKVLTAAGFKIEYSSYFFRFLPPAILLRRTLPYFLGLSGSIDPSKSLGEDDHQRPGVSAAAIVEKLLRTEIRILCKKRRMSFGGSLFVVAKSEV